MHLLEFLFLIVLSAGLCYGGRISPVSTASHVIIGNVLNSTTSFAGGLIPITKTKILVQKILKNTGNNVQPGDTISVLNYGGVIIVISPVLSLVSIYTLNYLKTMFC